MSDGKSDRGIKCPECACVHHRTLTTARVKGQIRRRRACRNCGNVFRTTETATEKAG